MYFDIITSIRLFFILKVFLNSHLFAILSLKFISIFAAKIIVNDIDQSVKCVFWRLRSA
jgi:hypothetical protein